MISSSLAVHPSRQFPMTDPNPPTMINYIALLVLVLVLGVPVSSMAAPSLPAYNIDENAVSVSGVSSGGYLAQQYHVAHSASIMGAAIIAAGPYLCAGKGYPWNLWSALNRCMDADDFVSFRGPPAVDDSIRATLQEAGRGLVDDPVNMQNDKVYLFSGTRDETVPQAVMNTLNDYYHEFVEAEHIIYVNHVSAGHGMVTDNAGNSQCEVTETPYINDCDYDTAGSLLKHIYGDSLLPPQQWDETALLAFDQGEFSPDIRAASMDHTGYIYVPGRCRDGHRCRLHIAFHGCRQHVNAIGDTFYKQSGYNEWAQANDIIVLYPQAISKGTALFPWPNPRGCWDWWGYTGAGFYHQGGLQLSAVKAMIDRLMGR